MTSGFYWYYTLTSDGERIEHRPCVLWYNEERNGVTLIGYEYELEFSPDRYEILRKADPDDKPE